MLAAAAGIPLGKLHVAPSPRPTHRSNPLPHRTSRPQTGAPLPLTAASTLALPFRADARLGTIAETLAARTSTASQPSCGIKRRAPPIDAAQHTRSCSGGRRSGRPTAERCRRESAVSDRPHLMFLAHRPKLAHMFESRVRSSGYALSLGLVAQHFQYFGGSGLTCLAAEVDVLCHRGLRVPELVSGRSCCQSGVVHEARDGLAEMCEVIPSYPARLKASRRSLRVFAGSRRVPISVEKTTTPSPE